MIHVLLHAQVTFLFGVRIGRRLDLHATSWLGSLFFLSSGTNTFFLVIQTLDCEYTHSCLPSFLGSGRVIVLRATFVACFLILVCMFGCCNNMKEASNVDGE